MPLLIRIKTDKNISFGLYTQNPRPGTFSRELYGIIYENISSTSPPIGNPLDFSLQSHSNLYATPLYHASQSYNFEDSSSSRYMKTDPNDLS